MCSPLFLILDLKMPGFMYHDKSCMVVHAMMIGWYKLLGFVAFDAIIINTIDQ